jgi:hypothetical protein
MQVAWWMRLGQALVGALVVHESVIAGGPHSHTPPVLAVAARSLTRQAAHTTPRGSAARESSPPCARACRSGRLCLRGGGSAAGADGKGKSGGRISLRDVACALELAAVGAAQSAGGAGHRGREGARQSRAASRNGALYLRVCVCLCVCLYVVCVCVRVCKYSRSRFTPICVCVCVCACTHTHTHTHTRTHKGEPHARESHTIEQHVPHSTANWDGTQHPRAAIRHKF